MSEGAARAPDGRLWRQLDSGRVVHRFGPFVLAATLLLIPVLVVESDSHSDGWLAAARIANWLIWAVFLADYLFVLTVATRKRAALRAHLLDLGVVVLTVPLTGSVLSSLRLLRLSRMLRLLRLSTLLMRALQRERALSSAAVFRFTALATSLLVVLAGAVEALVDKADFHSTWDGIWWAVTTVTTVGYGDIVPHSIQGRLVAMVVMFAGIGFLAVLTAALASRFVQTDSGADELRAALARIELELAELKQRLVVKQEKGH